MDSRGYVLDITRLVSRVGAPALTGIDRVERAYLTGLRARGLSVFGLLRTPAGFVLVSEEGLSMLLALLDGYRAPGPLDRLGRIYRKRPEQVRRAEADLRRRSIGRALRGGLTRMLTRRLPAGSVYLNVGHSNLSDRSLSAIRSAGLKVCVLIHDTIPLDLPQTQRPGTPDRFRAKFDAACKQADVLIATTRAGALALEKRGAPRKGHRLTAHIGIDLPEPDPGALPAGFSLDRPYVLAVGTIDARKNQGMLLDLWDELERDAPPLILAGSRGWGDAALMARLDKAKSTGRVVELAGLSDSAVSALIERATALLHPSLAEGFGFPPLEAALRGVPVICSDLPALRELLGDIPVYLSATEMYQWKGAVEAAMKQEQPQKTRRTRRPAHPTWDAHLDTILTGL